MHPGDLFVYSPACQTDPAAAIAACRAGARGTLDLEYVADPQLALTAIARLAEFATARYGLKLGVGSQAIVEALLADSNLNPAWVVLAGGDHTERAGWIASLAKAGIDVFVEAIDAAEMHGAIKPGVAGVILKGHEAGGRIGEETSFILLQRWFRQIAAENDNAPPVWVHGGIGLNTAPACIAGGAQGVVLDSQVLLTRETSWAEWTETFLRGFDGSQTAVFGAEAGERIRVAHFPRSALSEALARESRRLALEVPDLVERRTAWRKAVATILAGESRLQVRILGQDATSAAPLADRFRTVGGVVQALVERVEQHLRSVRRTRPLAEGSPLAASHGTRWPILQGPMTRVSDTAAFADAVAREGGLPFLALALLRKNEVAPLLAETKKRVGDRPWGAGILGFLPPEIRQEQTDAILEVRPPFALIAGGRPDQAKQFEDQGIPTYLHVPSPGLLRMFLKDGARRFILEGRECGGHVGPRSSFALWDAACEVILEHLGPNAPGGDIHLVFAGGIHDDLSGAMVAAMAARLAERGVRIGVLMGTAYLFTEEAVAGGAIVERFQAEALSCEQTVLLETGPGHAIRCVPSPYCDDFASEKARLEAQGKSSEEITRSLEWMNVGRLRVASKGLDRLTGSNGSASRELAEVAPEEQYARGMYMIGQLSALRGEVTTIAALHEEVCAGGTRRLEPAATIEARAPKSSAPCDIAIVGMSCFYPGAENLQQYWANILRRVYTVTEVPASHWDWSLYYDADPMAKDKIVSKWGGFLGDTLFDPFRYGISPAAMKVIEPLQFLLLEAVRHALIDAGYENRPFARERTAAICGIGGGGSPMATAYGFRTCMPLVNRVPNMPVQAEEIIDICDPVLPEWTEDSFPGFLMNVAVGRVSNRFDLGGPNFAIDAACASSLAAVQLCVRELQSGTSDVALAMGADTVQTPFAYMAFSKTFALSRQGRCRPFDAAADGIVLSEGLGVVVLKRLADAERDGDRIMAVIRGVGSSSDGRDKGLTAPNASGQIRALERAYAQAGVAPSRIELVEAHGTGTVVGDRTEAESLGTFLRNSGAEPANCAVGSVKSLIGHSKCAAGIGGLIKTAMALHHKVLPPTLVETPNAQAGFGTGPLYLNTEPRPWIHGGSQPRAAGVSAFGFGGTNFHAVLEEYTGDYLGATPPALKAWDAELIVCRQPTREKLLASVQQIQQGLSRGGKPKLVDLAAAAWRASSTDPAHPVLAIVVASLDELREKLPLVMQTLRGTDPLKVDPRGVYFAAEPKQQPGLALLFPGQGSQYPDMLADLAMAFDGVRQQLDAAEGVLEGQLPKRLGRYIYPPSAFDDEARKRNNDELARTDVAQPALAATSLGVLSLLEKLGAKPAFLAGHSFGEYTALAAAGALSRDELVRLAHRRGTLMAAAASGDAGGMAAVEADAAKVAAALAGVGGVTLANLNSPTQTVISAPKAALKTALKALEKAGLKGRELNVACGFHSPCVAGAAKQFAEALRTVEWKSPALPVYSNVTGRAHANDPQAIVAELEKHLASPVRFMEQIAAMHDAGARVFVEVGPQGVLTGLVKQVLGEREHVALATDLKGRPGQVQLAHTLAQMLVHGVALDVSSLYAKRSEVRFGLGDIEKQAERPTPSPSTWVVNSVRARPLHAPEPPLLGQSWTPEQVARSAVAPKPGAKRPAPASAASATPIQQPSVGASFTGPTAHEGTPNLNRVTPQTNGAPAQFAPAAATPSPAWTAAAPQDAHDDATLVMCRYQDLMAKFLDNQRDLMRDYLSTLSGGTVSAAPLVNVEEVAPAAPLPGPIAAAAPLVAPIVHETNGAPVAGEAVPAPAEPTPAPAAPAVAQQVSREELAARLLELVCKRTGYPQEMLDLDLDLEADLGVDSIKRVEILGTLAEGLGGTEGELGGKLELEKLTVLRTLRGILDYLEQNVINKTAANGAASNGSAAAPKAATNGAATNGKHAAHDTVLKVQRATVELVDAPLPAGGGMLIPAGAVLVTDDGRGIAERFAERLADFGQQVAFLRTGSAVAQVSDDVYTADLADAAQVEALVKLVHDKLGNVAGLVHLAPLADETADELPQDRAHRDVKSLYLLAQALESDLSQAASNGGAVLLAATSLGGRLGFEDAALSPHYRAGHGGLLGLTKCIAQEWEEVLVRAVDLDLERSPEELADALVAECSDPTGPVEIGLADRRVTWRPVEAPLDTDVEDLAFEPGSRVLITGGARGITARVAVALAEKAQPHIILVGRTPLPAGEEADDTRELVEPGDIKKALIARLREAGQATAPAAVEAEYRNLLAAREVRGTLAELAAAGSTWEYHAVDVRDREAFGRLIDQLNASGGVDGAIHGAGVIEDRLLRDKAPESFDRVFRTKVDSAYALAERLDPARLKFFILFASLASRYGNRGQSDYAAANEVLSKLAVELDRRFEAHVASIAWGPWSGVGMVAELEPHLTRRGLKLISPEEGPRFVLEELAAGRKGECEVIVAGGAEHLVTRPQSQPAATH